MAEIVKIQVGETVRSFDFPETSRESEGKNACYVEGVVEEIGRLIDWQSCDMYKIKCTRKVFGGKEIERREEYYFAPVNGTPTWTDKKTHGVVKV